MTASKLGSILSQDQLQAHAQHLASTHRLAAGARRGRPLLPALDESAARLDDTYRFLSGAARQDAQSPASEDWLRDNHHVVQDQVREIRQDLPRNYYRQLPKIADGPYQDFPRVYAIAREVITHTAGRLDLDTLVDFVTAYQEIAELSIGEVWAVPIMMRLALIEELRRLADGVASARRSRDRARQWQASMAAGGVSSEGEAARLLDDGRAEDGRLPAAFVVELLQWLRDQPSSAAPAWQALQHALVAQDDTPDELLRLEHQREAADQLAIGNIITSMRVLSSIDWTIFFERVSLVERVLREDPAGAYGLMDFPTRDRYRHSVEQLAARARLPETGVARRAVELAREARRREPAQDRPHHVGYYLISRGRFRLEQELGYRPRVRERVARFTFRHQAVGYLGAIAAGVAVWIVSLLLYAARRGGTDAELWLTAIVILLPVSELVISLLNLVVTAQIPPRPLPKLALRDGIPAADRTMVVVPVIVDSEPRLAALFDDLEVRFLGNRDPALHFALLSDFPDAGEARHDDDEALLAAARRRVDELNECHGAGRFYFFHRERRWNPAEGLWMGWERKRGKLAEFNRLLRGAHDTSFVVCHGDLTVLPSVRYVITLDSDTQLPMDAARTLVGTLSHPLNRPRFDRAAGRVTEGYGLLQPRIGVNVVSANRTAFSRVFSGHVGVDPYTTAVSDVYQDLFHEGSYVGKGIYDVDAFEAALEHRVPENALLSHDLFEGFYARAGLVTDIHLVDDYPGQYLAYAARQHRWVRGDWQIVRWLWRTVPDAARRPVRNTLPAIARWKIFDNLRRSLLAPALVLLLAAGWTVLPGSALVWTVLAMAVLAFPAYIQVARSLSNRVRGVPFGQHVVAERDNLVTSARQSFLSATFLAHQSWLMLDAIARTIWRLLVSHRRRLEWVSADMVSRQDFSAAQVFERMWAAPSLAFVTGLLVGWAAPSRLPLALPLLALWAASPWIAYMTGRPLARRREAIGDEDRAALRRIARLTWRFFEDLAGPDDNFLIPDNYQVDRDELVAHRTSPTNIGLQLVSSLAAYDLGYVSLPAVIERLEPTFVTLESLPRYRGHFYNWYETRRLEPLAPPYISTVDSGNLAGYLLTLASGLRMAVEHDPLIDGRVLSAVEDALGLCEEAAGEAAAAAAHGVPGDNLAREMADLRAHLLERPATLDGWRALLVQLASRLSAVGILLREIEEAGDQGASSLLADAIYWLDEAAGGLAARLAELDRAAPWIGQLPAAGWAIEAPAPGVSLSGLVRWSEQALAALGAEAPAADLRDRIERSRAYAQPLIERATRMAIQADALLEEMEFGFLFNPLRQLFSIGYSVSDGRLDASYYDTLASEARLASFIAIALGQVPHAHWFRLGRSLTPTGRARALLSWSASMFEYFMPLLVMRAYPGTLLDETYAAVVARQMQYGLQRGVPWGVSESAYNTQDLERNYQYRAFGVPGLGLKRGLAEDLVIAPYASILAAPLVPREVLQNLERLRRRGMTGRYGFYEALDCTPERTPPDRPAGVVLPTYMAHHQGMILVALDNALHDWPMQLRFHADPRVQSADLLLQERIPNIVPLKNPPVEIADHVPSARRQPVSAIRRYGTPHTLSPRVHLLSNGAYSVMVTSAGGGYSRQQQIAITRWREDVTADAWGSFCYVRDLDTGDLWSTGYQPTTREPDEYEVTFAPDRAVLRRRDDGIETRMEVVVSPEDPAELRRVSLTNLASRTRSLDLTSYAEVVLAPSDADLAHPAFSNLFVETKAVPDRDALMAVRRPRSGTGRLYAVHVLSGRTRLDAAVQYETDRARFVGRAGTLARPAALAARTPLSNTTGPVLDPILSLRQTVRLPPGATARFTFTTGFADSIEAAQQLVEKYHDRRAVARALALASTHSQIELRHFALSVDQTNLFQRLAGRLVYGDPRLRAVDAVAQNRRGPRELWKYGISGDLPVLLLRITDGTGIPLARDLLKAHEYLRVKGLVFDLVVLNEHPASYLQDLQQALQDLVEAGPEAAWIDKRGGVFLLRGDRIPAEDHLLLRAAARAEMDARGGGLRNQLNRALVPLTLPEKRPADRPPAAPPAAPPIAERIAAEAELFNGTGGFADVGREYVVPVQGDRRPPVPWTNVVAHERFGFACTESGAGCTWSGNSHDNRLTPWANDPVTDPPGEAVFLRDEENGAFWSATPLPAGGGLPYVTRHGQGYSVFEHARAGIASELTLFVPREDPVKIFRLLLRNESAAPRRLTVTLYVDWVLGENRSRTSAHVVTGVAPRTGAVVARNAFRQDFQDRVAFLDLAPGAARAITGDRAEFVGRNGSLAQPAAMARTTLSNRTGAAMDPCGAIQVQIVLAPASEQVLVGLLGDAPGLEAAEQLVERYRAPGAAANALAAALTFWDRLLGTLTVRTPDRSLDLMLNRWLLYQTLACRIWARTAFYQSSGAFGFRDQLQDTLALLPSAPALVRAHLVHAASRQFVEGDVQHWWHEPGGQGVRTRFSDDRLWLVYAALEYIRATGDAAVLEEEAPFLTQRTLNPEEHEAYEVPGIAAERASLYEHCVRAIAVSLATGPHGLPLIGTGDWNDGMSMVGPEGRGESVWLAWFLVAILRPFADVAEARGETDRAAAWRAHADAVTRAAEAAWDGDWYRRAYFDDGTPLGSKDSEECRIDAIAQSWAVLSGAADPARAARAMASVEAHLIRPQDRLSLLLTPPFDRMVPSPGYIQGYLPGVRENGGQYTHAALWNVLAFARLGDGDRAADLFALINPVNHTRTPDAVERYRAEPYVVAADVYSVPPHTGRGGWTWYTGSAGWMYRIGTEAILGITLRGGSLHVDPCIPRAWDGFEAVLKPARTPYRIVVENPARVNRGVARLEVDGVNRTGQGVPLLDDGVEHVVRVVLGTAGGDPAADAAGSEDAIGAGDARA